MLRFLFHGGSQRMLRFCCTGEGSQRGDRTGRTSVRPYEFGICMDINSLLQPYQRFGVHLGLERIQRLLAALGNPHQRIPMIHVAGTNGKGSVCAYLSSVLSEAGYRVDAIRLLI